MAATPAEASPLSEEGAVTGGAAQHSVTLRFRVPFPTRWGENLVLCGDDDRLGAWEPARGSWMQCFHVGDVLVWQVCAAAAKHGRDTRGRGGLQIAAAGVGLTRTSPPHQALVTVHGSSSFRYKYVVVDEHVRAPRREKQRAPSGGHAALSWGWGLCPSTAPEPCSTSRRPGDGIVRVACRQRD